MSLKWTRCTVAALAITALVLSGCNSDSTNVVTNTAPAANAGGDQVVTVGVTVNLDASASSDVDGDALTYSWTIVSLAPGSVAALTSSTAESTSFSADVAGVFEIQVTVSDGTASATDNVTITINAGTCDPIVDLFPVPVTNSTSPFAGIDDDYLEVAFPTGFQFSFYGMQYSSVFLNTNGGMTFGGGDSEFDIGVDDVIFPGIAVFWGDMDAAEHGGDMRANQMTYEACSDGFVVRYVQYQDNDNDLWNNTAAVSLYASGKIVIEYGEVLSEDIMAGVFDGAHTDDRSFAVMDAFPDYFTTGTGIIFFAGYLGPLHMGELTNRTIAFDPTASPASYRATLGASVQSPHAEDGLIPTRKGPKQR